MKMRLAQGFLVVGALLPLAAMARTVPGSFGTAVYRSEEPCFVPYFSAIYNSCSALRAYEFSLPVDTAGSKTVVVTAIGNTNANNVGCAAVGMNRETTIVWGNTYQYLPAFGSVQYLNLTGAYVPPSGYLYVNCRLDAFGQINTVEYNH